MNSLKSKNKVAVLGFSFKADTNDTRESSAIDICRNLLIEGELSIYDPEVQFDRILDDLNEVKQNKERLEVKISKQYQYEVIRTLMLLLFLLSGRSFII